MLYKQYLLCCVCYDRLEQVLSDKKSRLKNLCYINNIYYAAYAMIDCNKFSHILFLLVTAFCVPHGFHRGGICDRRYLICATHKF